MNPQRFLLIALLLTACSAPVTPPLNLPSSPVAGDPSVPKRSLGLFEITFTGGGDQPLSVQAVRQAAGLSAQTLTDLSNITLTALRKGTSDAAGTRNLQATFQVNTSTSAVRNLTFLAVSTSTTIPGTPISTFKKFDDTAANPAIASQITPSQPKLFDRDVVSIAQDAALFQAFTEGEVSVNAFPRPSGVTDVFPYGFVATSRTSGSRTLGANSSDGAVTFSFDLPLQPATKDNPFVLSVMVEAVSDDLTALTQSPEEVDPVNTALVQTRLKALQATVPGERVVLRKVTRCSTAVGISPLNRLFMPSLRTAGTATAPTTTLGPGGAPVLSLLQVNPVPFTNGDSFLPLNQNFSATFDQAVSGAASSFTVSGLQSGPLQMVSGNGTVTLSRSGTLRPGEEVELTVGSGLRHATDNAQLCEPAVFRYRTATTPEGASGFQPQVTYATGSSPFGVALGDVNGDGKLDLVTVNYNANTVSVLLGQGNGTFQPQVTYAVGTSPTRVALSDLNGDGKLDLITANNDANTVSVLLGQGNGTFQPQVTYAVGTNPYGVVVGDVNGDGKPDLVTVNNGSGSVSVLLGQGDGTFLPQVTYAVPDATANLALGDVNSDGKLDLIVTSGLNTVSVLLGQGNGTFQPQVTYPVGGNPFDVAVGDMNGDGKLDVVVTTALGGIVSVLLGQGDGTFMPPIKTSVGGARPTALSVGDVNGDGKLDVVMANTSPNSSSNATTVSLMLGQGNGSFQPQLSNTVGSTPVGVVLGDLNGDGKLDLITSNSGSDTVSVLLKR